MNKTNYNDSLVGCCSNATRSGDLGTLEPSLARVIHYQFTMLEAFIQERGLYDNVQPYNLFPVTLLGVMSLTPEELKLFKTLSEKMKGKSVAGPSATKAPTAPKRVEPKDQPKATYAEKAADPLKYESKRDKTFQETVERYKRGKAARKQIKDLELDSTKFAKIVDVASRKGKIAAVPTSERAYQDFSNSKSAFETIIGDEVSDEDFSIFKAAANANQRKAIQDLAIPDTIYAFNREFGSVQEYEEECKTRFGHKKLRELRKETQNKLKAILDEAESKKKELQRKSEPVLKRIYDEYPSTKPVEESWEFFLENDEAFEVSSTVSGVAYAPKETGLLDLLAEIQEEGEELSEAEGETGS